MNNKLTWAKRQEGVRFRSPHDGTEMVLTPEKSMELQNIIGTYIMYNYSVADQITVKIQKNRKNLQITHSY